jgi:hypothetical protein
MQGGSHYKNHYPIKKFGVRRPIFFKKIEYQIFGILTKTSTYLNLIAAPKPFLN